MCLLRINFKSTNISCEQGVRLSAWLSMLRDIVRGDKHSGVRVPTSDGSLIEV